MTMMFDLYYAPLLVALIIPIVFFIFYLKSKLGLKREGCTLSKPASDLTVELISPTAR